MMHGGNLKLLFIPVCSNKVLTCATNGILVIIPDKFFWKRGVH